MVSLAHSETNSLQGLKGAGDGVADASGEIATEDGTIVDKRWLRVSSDSVSLSTNSHTLRVTVLKQDFE
jgi:hypothetical protein